MKKNLLLFGILSIGLLFTSCEKEEDENEGETVSSENNATADVLFDHVYKIVDAEVNYAEEEKLGGGGAEATVPNHDTCAVITAVLSDDSTYVKTVTIDYGTDGCEWRGRTRKGKINIALTGRLKTAGTVATVTLENFYVDDFKVVGTKTITSKGVDLSNLSDITYGYDVSVSNAQITSPDGSKTFQWNSTRSNVWHINDGYFLVTGVANGVNVEGNAFTITITSPLKAVVGCPRIVSGKIKVTASGQPSAVLDYGSGACDNVAVVTIDEKNYTIILN